MACRQKKRQVIQAAAVAAGLLCMSALLNGAEASNGWCGGFTASCQYPFSISGSVLSASCAVDEDADGANYQYTSVDLNLHLMNQNGNLVAWGNDYIATCTPQGFACFGSSFFIFADCWQGDGNIISTSYDVNKNVQNNNGFLAWNNC